MDTIVLRFVHLKNLWEDLKMTDNIIRELWAIKDGIAKEYGYDIDLLANYLKSKQKAEGQRVIDLRKMKKNAEKRT